MRFLDRTQRRTTVGRTPLDEWSVRRRDLYLTTHNTYNRQTSMLPWNSNPQSQQASGRRPTPETARPMGPTLKIIYRYLNIRFTFNYEKSTNSLYRNWINIMRTSVIREDKERSHTHYLVKQVMEDIILFHLWLFYNKILAYFNVIKYIW